MSTAILQAVDAEREQRTARITELETELTNLRSELEQLDAIQTAAEGLGPAPAPEPAAPAAPGPPAAKAATLKPPAPRKRPARTTADDPAGGRGAKGAERRQAVLDTLKAAPAPLGAKDIQARCGIPAGSWHDVIRGLITDKLVIADGATSNRTYRLAGVKPPPAAATTPTVSATLIRDVMATIEQDPGLTSDQIAFKLDTELEDVEAAATTLCARGWITSDAGTWTKAEEADDDA